MSKKKPLQPTADHKKAYAARIPLGVVLNISLLAASLNVLLQLSAGDHELYSILLRSTLIFIGFAIAGSLVMIVTITILHQIKRQELEEQRRLAEEEQLAAMLTMPAPANQISPPSHQVEATNAH